MANQLFEDGSVIEHEGNQLECVAVGYQEAEGVKSNFTYTFQLKSELDTARHEAAEADRLRREAEEAANQPTVAHPVVVETAPLEVSEPVNQPEEPQEETQYVK